MHERMNIFSKFRGFISWRVPYIFRRFSSRIRTSVGQTKMIQTGTCNWRDVSVRLLNAITSFHEWDIIIIILIRCQSIIDKWRWTLNNEAATSVQEVQPGFKMITVELEKEQNILPHLITNKQIIHVFFQRGVGGWGPPSSTSSL